MSANIKILLAVLVTGFVVAAGEYVWHTQRLQRYVSLSSGAVKYNCELSDGTYKNGFCECPHSPEIGQTSESMYDFETGFCQTEAGGAGGDAFLAESGLPFGDYFYFLEVVGNNCKKSGGTFAYGHCQCAKGRTYNKSNGYCE